MTPSFPVSSALRLTLYSESREASWCFVSMSELFTKGLESTPNLLGTSIIDFSVFLLVQADCRQMEGWQIIKKKRGKLKPNLQDVIMEGNFRAIAPNTHYSGQECGDWVNRGRILERKNSHP